MGKSGASQSSAGKAPPRAGLLPVQGSTRAPHLPCPSAIVSASPGGVSLGTLKNRADLPQDARSQTRQARDMGYLYDPHGMYLISVMNSLQEIKTVGVVVSVVHPDRHPEPRISISRRCHDITQVCGFLFVAQLYQKVVSTPPKKRVGLPYPPNCLRCRSNTSLNSARLKQRSRSTARLKGPRAAVRSAREKYPHSASSPKT